MRKLAVLLFAIAISPTFGALNLILPNQVADQRDTFVAPTGSITFVTDDESYPLAVSDGKKMRRIAGVDGTVPRLRTTSVTNDAEWIGWSVEAVELRANGLLAINANGWAESPRLSHGIVDYDASSIYSDQNATTWTITVYTNTPSTPVALPYTGTNAYLRVSYSGGAALLGGGEQIVKVPKIIYTEYVNIDVADVSGFQVPNLNIITPPAEPEQMARYDTVLEAEARANAYADTQMLQYDLDSNKTLRGSMLFAGDGWVFVPASSPTNANMSVGWGGINLMELTSDLAGCTVTSNYLTFSTNIVEGATNFVAETMVMYIDEIGVTTEPVIEYCTELGNYNWQPTAQTSTWPTADNGAYVITVEIPDHDSAFYRCIRSYNAEVAINADLKLAGSIITQGTSNGVPKTATQTYDFTNNVWITTVTDD